MAEEKWKEEFLKQEDLLIMEYADRWDRDGSRASKSERVMFYITAVDDGEASAVKPLQIKLKELRKAHKHVERAVHLDRRVVSVDFCDLQSKMEDLPLWSCIWVRNEGKYDPGRQRRTRERKRWRSSCWIRTSWRSNST